MVSSARLAVMFSSSPTPTTARPPGVADAPVGSSALSPGSAMVASTSASTCERVSNDDGPTWNSTWAALPLSAIISCLSVSGAIS